MPPESEPDSDSIRKLLEFRQRAETQRTMASEAAPKKLDTVLKSFNETMLARVASPEEQEQARQKADERERQQTEADREQRWAQLVSQVGRRYSDATLGGYVVGNEVQRKAVARVQDYAASIEANVREGRNLVLYGPPGTGKDHLAVAVCRRAIGAGIRCVAIDGQALFQAARDAIGKEISETELLSPYLRADLLLISDPVPPLETTKGTSDYQLTVLWRIVDGRYRDLKPTIVTINVKDRAELDRRLAPNIVDRLIDGSVAVPCKWESYRRSAKP
jgi:DNA replication protein DnaC